MADIFWDGFDKYLSPLVLTDGEWTRLDLGAITISDVTFIPGQFSGKALQVILTNAGITQGSFRLNRTIAENATTLIVGCRIATDLNHITFQPIIFGDSGTDQCSVGVDGLGRIVFSRGGTIIGTSVASITANVQHYLEASVTFHSSAGAYQVNLDGVEVLSGSGVNTVSTANNFANTVNFHGQGIAVGTSSTFVIDDYKCFDTTGAHNNAMSGDQRVETLFVTGDVVNSSTISAGVLGHPKTTTVGNRGTGTGATIGAAIVVIRVLADYAANMDSIGFLSGDTSPSFRGRPVIYSESAGLPDTLLATGPELDNIASGVEYAMPFTVPFGLTAGTAYWIGIQSSGGYEHWPFYDNTLSALQGAVAFGGAPPGTFPALGGFLVGPSVATPLVWGNLDGASITGHWEVLRTQPPAGNKAFVTQVATADRDLFTFDQLASLPREIAGVKVSGYVKKADAGPRTVFMELDSAGNFATGAAISPAQSFAWLSSYYDVDPGTGVAFTATAVNGLAAGQEIAS